MPGAKHFPPFAQSKDLHFPYRLDIPFVFHAGQRKLVRRGVVISAKQNIPDGKKRDKIFVAMLRKKTVMNAMGLRAYEPGARLAKLQSQIAVVYENH